MSLIAHYTLDNQAGMIPSIIPYSNKATLWTVESGTAIDNDGIQYTAGTANGRMYFGVSDVWTTLNQKYIISFDARSEKSNLITSLTAGGRCTITNGVITTTGENMDTYFRFNMPSAFVLNRKYVLTCFVTGMQKGKTWTFGINNKSDNSFALHDGYNYFVFDAKQGSGDAGASSILFDDIAYQHDRTIPIKIYNFAIFEAVGCDMSRSIADFTSTIYVTGEWQRYFGVITTTATATGGTISFRIASANTPVHIKNMKLVKGDDISSYMPISGTTDWADPYNIERNICQNNYHGTKNHKIMYSEDNWGKYSSSTEFKDSEAAITIGNLYQMLGSNTSASFTFNIWFKKRTGEWASKNYETILGGPSGFELEAKPASSNTAYIRPYSWGGSDGSKDFAYALDQWNMLTMVRTSSESKFYLNGAIAKTATAGSIPNGTYFLGAWSTAASQNYRGLMSDARIYDHALTEDQILNLYRHGSEMILPSGYRELMYLTLDGNQRIDTGIKFNPTIDGLETTFQASTTSQNGMIVGAYGGSPTMFVYVYKDGGTTGFWYPGGSSTDVSWYNTNLHHVRYQNKVLYWDSSIRTLSPSNSETQYNMGIGNAINSPNYGFKGNIYTTTFWRNGIMTRKFIPAKRTADNILGFYDVANNTFYTNVGTGNFVAGPQVSL